jgi:hypothetical protein
LLPLRLRPLLDPLRERLPLDPPRDRDPPLRLPELRLELELERLERRPPLRLPPRLEERLRVPPPDRLRLPPDRPPPERLLDRPLDIIPPSSSPISVIMSRSSFMAPPVCLFTVAQARRSASSSFTPRDS